MNRCRKINNKKCLNKRYVCNRVAAITMSCALIAGGVSPIYMNGVVNVLADDSGVSQETDNRKEEVIYINTTASGEVKDIYAVNIFNGGNVTDYGDYSSVEMLNTTEDIVISGDKVTFSSDMDRVYYKGKMKNNIIPWNISVKYFIDDKEYTAADVAGKSGKMRIEFKVTENEEYSGGFYDSYALQASFTLDTNKCTNIKAENATVANVGADKQISYTMLPGKGIEAQITADVVDFEMDAASINGVPLSLDVEVDDSELLDQVNELLDAIKELDDGATELYDGTTTLNDSVSGELGSGVNELNDGATQLDDGIKELYDGILTVRDGLNELNSKSSELTEGSAQVKAALVTIQTQLSAVDTMSADLTELVSGSSAVKTGISRIADGLAQLQANVNYDGFKAAFAAASGGQSIDTLQGGNTSAISALNSQISQLDSQISALEAAGNQANQSASSSQAVSVAALKQQKASLEQIKTVLEGDAAAIYGVETYLDTVSGSIAQLSAGASQLNEQYAQMDAGINELATQLSEMLVNMTKLKNVIDELVTQYTKLDNGLNEYTGGVAKIVSGYSELVSGAKKLLSGSSDLKSGTDELASKTSELVDGVSEIYDGTGRLTDGTSELRSQTDGMDDKITDKIDEMLESITGENAEIKSFTSDKNTGVKAVQFVIQTEKIAIPEVIEEAVETTEPTGFWHKLLKLFGL